MAYSTIAYPEKGLRKWRTLLSPIPRKDYGNGVLYYRLSLRDQQGNSTARRLGELGLL